MNLLLPMLGVAQQILISEHRNLRTHNVICRKDAILRVTPSWVERSAQPLKSCVARGKILLFPFISVHLTAGKIPAYLPGLLGKWDTVFKCLEYGAGTYRPSGYLSSQLTVL